jgi:hypothetical protein
MINDLTPEDSDLFNSRMAMVSQQDMSGNRNNNKSQVHRIPKLQPSLKQSSR